MLTLHQGIPDKGAVISKFQEISRLLLWHILLDKLCSISCQCLNDKWQGLEQAMGNERPENDPYEDEEDDDDDDEEEEQEEGREEEIVDEDEDEDDDDDDDLISI